ncbi:glycosyltransferase family 4 protein [Rothia sp. HC945]|uniref:glycosyltransferase family 4 protein n=1 Tax=Rothia sp. HC945 TaxID=3171170 RepID=UPI003F1E5096
MTDHGVARHLSETDTTIRSKLSAIKKMRPNQARIAYRELLVTTGLNSEVLTHYGRFLVESAEARAAEEILALALEVDGANVDALELFMAVQGEIKAHSSRQRWALNRLEEDILTTPRAHRAALDYIIPHRLDRSLRLLRHSEDTVVRAAVRLNAVMGATAPEGETLATAVEGLSQTDTDRAMLIVSMARGRSGLAENVLQRCEVSAVPVDSARRAIRRTQQTRKPDQTEIYVRAYLKARPKDSWGKQQLDKVAKEHTSDYQLSLHGFPFSPTEHRPVYEAQKNKVLYLLYNSLPFHSAGYATRSQGLIHGLNELGWDVDGVTRLAYPYDMPGYKDVTEVPALENVDGVGYHRLLLPDRQIMRKKPVYPYTQKYAESVEALARETKPALIHAASNYVNGVTGVQTAQKLGLPSIYEIRGLWEITRVSREPDWGNSDLYRHMVRMETDAARQATKVLTITNALREEMIARGVGSEKITVLPNGVNTDRFQPLPRDEALAERLGVQGKTVIGYIGSILDYEGIGLILEAARQLAAERNDFHVLVVGDGPEKPKLEAFVRDEGLQNFVTFTGRVPHAEVEGHYSLIDIAPFPRLPLPVCEMVSPLKPFEAMAMGKAVVASDVAALAEIVRPGVNGRLHHKGDADNLKEQLQLLMDNPEHARMLGVQARDWVVEHHDWRKLAGRVSDIYSSLVT